MKILFVLLFVCSLSVYANDAYSQKVTMEIKNSTVLDALKEIENETGLLFVYNKEDLNLKREVSVQADNKMLTEVLSQLFSGTGIAYVIAGNNIVLTKNNVQQNNRKVTGNVVDNYGEPVIGANVMEKGTTNGTITDIDGNFSLNVSPNSTLVISFIGYLTQEIPVANTNNFNIQLKEDAKTLDEVVVVGYGTMRKKDLTGSVIQIRPENIANEAPRTVQDVLRGTPGLNVGYDSSAKGGGTMELRGQRSVYTDGGHNNPLLILDGMIFYGELSEINPADIGQIDILKDASAAAVYGAKAASGVLIITTKKGKVGKPVVNVTASVGLNDMSDYRERFSPDAYLQHRQEWLKVNSYDVNPETGVYEAYQRRDDKGNLTVQPGYYERPETLGRYGVSQDTWKSYSKNDEGESDLSIWAKRMGFQGNALTNLLAGKTVDWAKKTYRTGFNQDYNASISGASEKANYYLSFGYLRNEGVKKSDGYHAFRANMKVNATVNKWLEVGANVNFQDRSDGEIGIDEDQMTRNSPYGDYYDENGNVAQYPMSGEFAQRGYNYDFLKQYLELEKGYTVLNSILNAKVTLPWNITYTFNASPRYQFHYDRYFMSADLPGSDPKARGANREQRKWFDWSLNNTINWDYTFLDKHHVILTLVQEAEERKSWKDRIEARNILPSDALGFHNTKNGAKENSTYSSEDSHQTADALLARLFYSYDNRYMVTGSVRRDGYSAFGQSNPYATFPSIAVAWTFTNEKFFNWNHIMDMGKLRISYGKNGNRSLDNPYLALANLYEGGGKMQGYINSSGELELLRYLMAQRMANPNLQWEKTASWNFALDFGFLNNRISGTLEYYNMKTHDMIMNQVLPSFTGFSSITTNLGQVDNRGIDISLSTLNINNKNFQWTTTFGFSYNQNKIKHLYYEYEDVLDENGNVTGTKERDEKDNGWFIGQPISTIWDYRVTGIWQVDEIDEAAKHGQRPGDPKVKNNPANDEYNEDGTVKKIVYNNDDKEFLGQKTPPVAWSLRNEFTLWKDLTVSFNIYSKMGHKSVEGMYLNNDDDGGRMQYALANMTAKEYWTPDNPTNKYGRIQAQGPNGAGSPKKLYDRSFIRLENISVGYTIPKKFTSKLDIERAKVFGTIRNAAVWGNNNWVYGDPETGGVVNRVYTLGVNLTF